MILRIKTVFIVFLVSLRYIFFGKADAKNNTVKRVLIMQGGKLGDMICTTSMFRAVKAAYPECKVIVVGNPTNKLVLEYNPDVDVYLVDEEYTLWSLIKKIQNEKVDFACITAPSTLGVAILYLAGVPCIATPTIKNAWSPYETKSYKVIRNFVLQTDYYKGNYMPGEFLKLLQPIGIVSKDTKKYVFWSTQAEVAANEYLSKIDPTHTLWVGIMPGAGNKIKEWPPERFATVANHLITTHQAHIFIIGNESNRKEIDTMISEIDHKDHLSDCSKMSLDLKKALIPKLHMTVSVDTGPIFIAEAHGVPTIDIGGVIHPNDMAPNDGKFHLLITYGGEPMLWSMNARVFDYEEARAGVESITAPMVIEKVEELLVKIRARARDKM